MGKAAGAAVKIAAPEAAAAAGAAGKARGTDPRRTAPGSKAAKQRQAIEDLKDNRPDEDQAGDEPSSPAATSRRDSSGPSLSAPFAGMQGPATGGGFVLGVMVWALVRAYIGNPGQPSGTAGVKRLLRAKFLNQTS